MIINEPPQEEDQSLSSKPDQIAINIINQRMLWAISITVSLLLVLVLIRQWSLKGQAEKVTSQITDQANLDAFLEENWFTRNAPDALTVPTGVYIQSLMFLNDSDVHISGYIWERLTDGVHDDITEGFILPEQIDSFVELREDYRVRMGNEEVIGWYFEGAFRHPYNYNNYPFDHKTVWMRIWPQDLNKNILLVPDFKAYPCPTDPELICMGEEDIFGINQSIVLDEFEREDTYFDYSIESYNTNFGVKNNIGQDDSPELRYNILLRRCSMDAFIIYIVPLIVVAILAYITLLVTTQLETKTLRFGFSTFQVITIITALIFVVVISQGQIRQNFPGSGFVYLETFYYLMYMMLLYVAVNAYLVSLPESAEWWIVSYEDDLFPKLLYWPLLLTILVIITALTL